MHQIWRPTVRTVLALTTTVFLAGQALAQAETGGVRIRGSVNTQVSVDGSDNLAAGSNSVARTDVGSIGGGASIEGRLNVTVQTGPIATVAAGAGQEARTSVGSVREDVAGQTDVVISTGAIINMTERGSGRPACVVIGTLGAVPGC